MSYKHLSLTFFICAILVGCATNPVTGEKELSLVSEKQELAIGNQQYAPLRQAQGGDYIVDTELTTYINEVGQRLAAVSDRKLPYEFKVLNNSIPNAWALPGGKISINRGLLTQLKSEAELAAVLGHEIVHAAAKHAVRQMSKGMLLQTAVVGTAIATQGESYGGLAQLGAGIGAQLLSKQYGRDAERESDYYGMLYMSRAGYNPQGAVDLQRTFVKLSHGGKQDWLSGLFASHPASEERVQNNLKHLQTLPKGGDMGTARYQTKIAYLLQTKPAYDAYDKGRKALAKGDVQQAQVQVKQAIAIEPKEALFYGLTGDIAQKAKQFKAANIEYNKAIKLDPNFFYYYLQRGQTYQQLGQTMQAKADLEKSITFLPTTHAFFTLGNIERSLNNIPKAKAYYAKVAGNKGDIPMAAYAALVELDIQDNPDKYLKLRVGKDAAGRILAEITNPTPKHINNIQLALQYQGVNGVTHTRRSLKAAVQAGKKQTFDLGLQGVTEQQLQSLRIKVIHAQVAP